MNYKIESIILICLSLLFSVSFNYFRPNGISWIKKPLDKLDDINNMLLIKQEPSIREIDLNIAHALHNKNVLFVDARSQEYLMDGFIPGAIADDDIEILANMIDEKIGFEKEFVIYCSDDDCGSSQDLAHELQEMGFFNILVFRGGWKSWLEAGFEIGYHE